MFGDLEFPSEGYPIVSSHLIKISLAVVALLFASESNAQRRRQQNRNGRLRGGRQLDTGYGAPESREEPETLYGAPSEEVLDVRAEEELPSYAEEAPLDTYNNDLDAEASALDSKSADSGLDMLMNSIPGIPGEDYPIYSEAPETEFSCEGQVNGGTYLFITLFLLCKLPPLYI